ncbi:hypothetical protein N7495_005179 [Penicillium taxi]|uniref:uncharacterized protein n=1 Tax=Penicillium taxi TaxID=168475 RepID=UPI002544F2E8|nr:uncharacterized protein N7495_005179 [Penicillium taxi]KAJ5893488.1 hypothetical protein N7495_005179 [Penicillium taxi]
MDSEAEVVVCMALDGNSEAGSGVCMALDGNAELGVLSPDWAMGAGAATELGVMGVVESVAAELGVLSPDWAMGAGAATELGVMGVVESGHKARAAKMSDKEVFIPNEEPDIIVGIDFGMTFTGVAYSSAPEWLPPKTIQRWPGGLPGDLANKVPTCIEYDDESGLVKRWGFQCDQEQKSSHVKEFFKLHLAPQYHDDYSGLPTRQEAQKWFQDYIQCLYRHVVTHFQSTIPQFVSRHVEFIFSVPTTWKDVRMIEETRRLLESSISAKTPMHSVSIGLTEAEAAAVYASNGFYKTNDTILDLNILKLKSDRGDPAKLDQLGHVEGQPIGSVFIDRKIHQLIQARLEGVREHLNLSPSETAWRMISGRFQRLKCAFGTEVTSTPGLKLDIPSMKTDLDDPKLGIYDGQMMIDWKELKLAFDLKIDETIKLMDGHIAQMKSNYPDEKIKYLVLSGGFGSSSYVRQRLMEKYDPERDSNGKGMQVLVADEPYGIVCDKIYHPEQHLGEPVRIDARDKLTYAVDQVEWIVIQGLSIPTTGLTKQFQLKVDKGRENESWKVSVVMSVLPPDKLPQNFRHQGVHQVCDLDIATYDVEKKLKNRHWYNTKPAFWRSTFDENHVK